METRDIRGDMTRVDLRSNTPFRTPVLGHPVRRSRSAPTRTPRSSHSNRGVLRRLVRRFVPLESDGRPSGLLDVHQLIGAAQDGLDGVTSPRRSDTG
jgi:hypothetical protein